MVYFFVGTPIKDIIDKSPAATSRMLRFTFREVVLSSLREKKLPIEVIKLMFYFLGDIKDQ